MWFVGVEFECAHYQSNVLLMEDIVFVDRTDHNAYLDAATAGIKDVTVGGSEAMPRDFNEEQVRTIRDIMHDGLHSCRTVFT